MIFWNIIEKIKKWNKKEKRKKEKKGNCSLPKIGEGYGCNL